MAFKVLPLPFFSKITRWRSDGPLMVFIAPAVHAGLPARYNVFKLNRDSGALRCIGRELTLRHARQFMDVSLSEVA